MKKLEAYGCIFLGCVSCFTYGMYTYSTMHNIRVVEPHQWILTGLFGIFFMVMGLDKYKNLE